MSSLILAFDTALAYWSRKDAAMPASTLSAESANRALEDAAGSITVGEIRAVRHGELFAHLPERLDLLVPRAADHRTFDEAVLHSMQRELPPRSLVRVDADTPLLVASPEYLFVQMARFMDLAELIELGFELCGCYAVSPAAEEGMVDRQPVTTPQRLVAYLAGADGMYGAKLARVASRFVLANSKSPKESQLAMLATLDRRYGGFALPAPLLNNPIGLGDAAQEVTQLSELKPDLYWPQISTVIEYDSNEHHVGTVEGERDARRRTGYELMGLNAIAITYGQLSSLATIAAVLDSLARKFGRVRHASTGQLQARSLLHRTVLYGPKRKRFADPTLADKGRAAE